MKKNSIKKKDSIAKPKGKIGVLIPGIGGAVSTTFIAGLEAVKQGLAKPFGSLTQMGTIRLGKRDEYRVPMIKDFINLASLRDLMFCGWDVYADNCYDAAIKAGVLERSLIESVKYPLQQLKPLPAVFRKEFVKNLDGTNIKPQKKHLDLVEALKDDIKSFKKINDIDRCIMIWCASTESYLAPQDVHSSIPKFEKGLKKNDPAISPSMLYAYAAITSGIPYINGSPSLTVDIPAMVQLAKKYEVPISGKDFKTGQTLMKTILAPGLKARLLGLQGWYSTNILGNRDGAVLDDAGSFKTKEESKLSVLKQILQPDVYPDLYGDFYHKVAINYYPPRGDNKEGWDCVDIFGWLGYPMHIKINFLCRDSILAAPVALDLLLFTDFAKRSGLSGIQEWLSFYFKSPMHAEGLYPEHDLFIQLMKLKNTLRFLMGEEQITHLGLEYYID
jgi:myo-inositol-1-phosphate synthase